MSTTKQLPQQPPGEADAQQHDDDDRELLSSSLENIEVASLELDERFDVDTDPYNRTGSHFVAAIRRNDD